MKRVLLTNFSMTNYTGSEIDTVTMAQYFLEHDYDVSIFTINYGYPLLSEIDDKIKLYDYSSVDLMDKHFDLVWAHHFPVLDYLLFSKKIDADYICYISLSSFMGYEAFPVYYKDLSYLAILSKEAFDVVTAEGYDTRNINIFPNYSFKKYFDKEVKLDGKIKNICIVSNHVPEEVIDMAEIFSSKNFNVDIYGMGYKYVKVDEELLSKYDLIISIGKTINYGISLGIPCYCYDRFGGDGYISLDNIDKSFECTFSGKYLRSKKNGKELYNDIIKNYKNIVKEQKKLKKWAYDNFCYEKMMENTLKKIYSSKRFDINKLLKKYPTEIRRLPLFVDTVASKLETIKLYEYPLEFCQFYFDIGGGEGFTEKNSKKMHYIRLNNNDYYVKIKVPDNVKKIRFDYSEKLFTKLNSIEINKKVILLSNLVNTIYYNNKYISINNDPAIFLDINEKELEIKVNMEFLNSEEVISEITNDVHSLKMLLQEMDEKRIKNRIKKTWKNLFKKKL